MVSHSARSTNDATAATQIQLIDLMYSKTFLARLCEQAERYDGEQGRLVLRVKWNQC